MQKWSKELDSFGEWLRYGESGGKVTRIFSALCTKHKDRLYALRNFSTSFVDGIKEGQCQQVPAIGHAYTVKSDAWFSRKILRTSFATIVTHFFTHSHVLRNLSVEITHI